MKKVLIVGLAEKSGGGVASVLRLMKTMPFWVKYHCGWLGTQIQRGYGVKLWFALKAYFKALFTIWQYNIVHFHTVKAKTAVIYNACAPTPAVDYSIKEKSIIMAAFLNDNKHPDLLLKAWKNLKADFPDWHVTIMGNGEVERFQRYGSNYGFG